MPNFITNLLIISEDVQTLDINITLAWDASVGMGAEAVVDYYVVSLVSNFLSHPVVINVTSLSLEVTLHYNEIYNASVTAVNCVGSSNLTTISDIQYSKYIYIKGKLHEYNYYPKDDLNSIIPGEPEL